MKKACEFLITKAFPAYDPKTCGNCAAFVRSAVDFQLGKKIPHALAAKNYGACYEKVGFKKVFSYPGNNSKKEDYKPELGDICIIQYEPYGHICMLTEKGWISDFKQRDMYGGKIRDKNPNFEIYRYAST